MTAREGGTGLRSPEAVHRHLSAQLRAAGLRPWVALSDDDGTVVLVATPR